MGCAASGSQKPEQNQPTLVSNKHDVTSSVRFLVTALDNHDDSASIAILQDCLTVSRSEVKVIYEQTVGAPLLEVCSETLSHQAVFAMSCLVLPTPDVTSHMLNLSLQSNDGETQQHVIDTICLCPEALWVEVSRCYQGQHGENLLKVIQGSEVICSEVKAILSAFLKENRFLDVSRTNVQFAHHLIEGATRWTPRGSTDSTPGGATSGCETAGGATSAYETPGGATRECETLGGANSERQTPGGADSGNVTPCGATAATLMSPNGPFMMAISTRSLTDVRQILETFLQICQWDISVDIERIYPRGKRQSGLVQLVKVIRTPWLHLAETVHTMLSDAGTRHQVALLYHILSRNEEEMTSLRDAYVTSFFGTLADDIRAEVKDLFLQQTLLTALSHS